MTSEAPDPLDPCSAAAAASGIDCRQVLADVYLYLDGQLDPGRVAELRGHLDACGPCLADYGIEEHVKTLVGRCCGGDAAPEGLRHKVLATLSTISLTTDDGVSVTSTSSTVVTFEG